MARIFLTENFNEGHVIYFAINSEKIETINVSDTYDKFGQRVDASTAGDSVDLITQEAADFANKEYDSDRYSMGDNISSWDDSILFDAIETKFPEGDENVTYNKDTIKGFNYWNGQNWRTVTTSWNFGEATHSIIDDKEIINELEKAIEEKEFREGAFGTRIYDGNGYVIINSRCVGDWAEYEIIA